LRQKSHAVPAYSQKNSAKMPPTTPQTPTFKLILASSSTYRRELLSRLQLPFEAIAPDIDESARAGEAPEQTALRLALEKARAIAPDCPQALIIGSDQVATLDGEQIGKPGNHANALRQLQKMRGKQVVFHTALCLLDTREGAPEGGIQIQNVPTLVSFRDLSDAELDAYLRIEQPYDCAGSAKNEGLGIIIIEKMVSEDPTALTGLPLIALTSMLRNAHVKFFNI
jgi:septum formation protein